MFFSAFLFSGNLIIYVNDIGSVGRGPGNRRFYPEFDASVYAPFCAFAALIVAQKFTTTAAQMSKALER